MIVIPNLSIEDKNFYYLSGIEEPCRGILVQGETTRVLVSRLEAGIAEKYVDTVVFEGENDLWKRLKAELSGTKEVGINFARASLRLRKLFEKHGFKKFKDVGKELETRRSLKSKDEVDKIRNACRVASKSLELFREKLVPGVSELELKAELEFLAGKQGAMGFSFDTIIASGENTTVPHAVPTNRILKEGDSIVVDFGPTHRLYVSDITRTFSIGKNADFVKRYELVLKAQEAAIEALEGGVNSDEIQKLAENIIGEKLIHSIGHGVGLDTHEQPEFANKPLFNGMVFTIEPGVYRGFGIRIEDVVWMDGRAQLLTSAPKDLDFSII